MFDSYELIDRRFRSLLLANCEVGKLHTGTLWAEGPCWFADGEFLIWSDIPNERMMRWVEGLGSTSSASRPATPTATPATARAGSYPASTAPGG
jgi:gluconolactonase